VIRDCDETLTPKQYAQRVLLGELDGAYQWQEFRDTDEIEAMTDDEKEAINVQLGNLCTRLRKLLGR
jgi:hypothetical protein